ncbi:hypothetical protein [Clostridium sp. B9]|uniref:hypothetical protein n=1 Tax=Clostridium sp. B9 TaxID=3423224 RepID=UPI003D2E9EDD
MTYFDETINNNSDLYFEIQSLRKSLYKVVLTLKNQQIEYEENQRKLEEQLDELTSVIHSCLIPEGNFESETDNKNSSKVEIGDVGNKIAVSIDIAPIIGLILLLIEKNDLYDKEDFSEIVSKLKEFTPDTN